MKKLITFALAATLLTMTSCEKEIIEPTTPNTTTKKNLGEESPLVISDPEISQNAIKTTTVNPPSNLTLVQYFKGENDHSIFYEALTMTGISLEISANGSYTVFAPTNKAFQNFFANNNYSSLNEIPFNTLTKIVKFHISTSKIQLRGLTGKMSVPTLNSGKEIIVNMDMPNYPYIVLGYSDGEITKMDLKQSNGIVHTINGVLHN